MIVGFHKRHGWWSNPRQACYLRHVEPGAINKSAALPLGHRAVKWTLSCMKGPRPASADHGLEMPRAVTGPRRLRSAGFVPRQTYRDEHRAHDIALLVGPMRRGVGVNQVPTPSTAGDRSRNPAATPFCRRVVLHCWRLNLTRPICGCYRLASPCQPLALLAGLPLPSPLKLGLYTARHRAIIRPPVESATPPCTVPAGVQ